jgi:hypothetical protein
VPDGVDAETIEAKFKNGVSDRDFAEDGRGAEKGEEDRDQEGLNLDFALIREHARPTGRAFSCSRSPDSREADHRCCASRRWMTANRSVGPVSAPAKRNDRTALARVHRMDSQRLMRSSLPGL